MNMSKACLPALQKWDTSHHNPNDKGSKLIAGCDPGIIWVEIGYKYAKNHNKNCWNQLTTKPAYFQINNLYLHI